MSSSPLRVDELDSVEVRGDLRSAGVYLRECGAVRLAEQLEEFASSLESGSLVRVWRERRLRRPLWRVRRRRVRSDQGHSDPAPLPLVPVTRP